MLTLSALVLLTITGNPPLPWADLPAAPTAPTVESPELARVLRDLIPGDTGPLVAALNQALAEKGFRPGEADGFDSATRHAVIAFQKVHDLERDAVFRIEDWNLLVTEIALPWREQATRVEVDLGRQVLFLVDDNTIKSIVPVSSGNGATYINKTGRTVRATTPEGRFSFYSRINGLRRSYLGVLYRPFYFRGGYAIHGSPSVPAYPASHGCIRVPNSDMDYLWGEFDLDMPVLVYGKRTDPPPADVPRSGQPVMI